MTEHDEVIDTLRRHRPEDLPDEVVSPHAPAGQALLEEILSMQTIDPVEPAAAVLDYSDVPDTQRRRSRRAVTIAGAAAAAAAAVVAASVVVRPADPSAASTVDAAIALSLESLDVSGRAEIAMHEVYADEQGNQKWVQDSVDTWEYSGDDSSVTGTFRINGIDAIPGDVDPINRRVDGEFYCYCRTSGRCVPLVPRSRAPRERRRSPGQPGDIARPAPTRRRLRARRHRAGRRCRDHPIPFLPACRHPGRCPPRELGTAG
jgi:hypothetical protein